jgi:hypothetical protein
MLAFPCFARTLAPEIPVFLTVKKQFPHRTETMTPKFELGQVVTTPGAMQSLERAGQDAAFFLEKHVTGDWGNVCQEDQNSNFQALRDGDRLVSMYMTLKSEAILIITEHDRSATTILLPEEY